jgi:hypothetical protein
MKKFSLLLFSLILVFALTGGANAAPITYVDTIDWNPNSYISAGNTFSYFHNIKDDGFTPSLCEGGICSYELEIALVDDDKDSWWELCEVALVTPFGDLPQPYNFSYSSNTFDSTLLGILDLNHDGTLNVWIKSTWGDFKLDWSRLTASECAVPEPAMMIFLGSGLVGLLAANRKRLLK